MQSSDFQRFSPTGPADDAIRWLETAEPKPPEALLDRIREAVLEAAAGAGTTGGDSRMESGAASDDAIARAVNAQGRTAAEGPSPDPRLAAEAFVEAALDRLRGVIQAERGRGTAFDLLAADALLTYACEAAAEAGPETLDAIVRACGPAALAEALLEEAR